MSMQRFEEWQPIRAYGQGIQQRTGKHWNCEPAWDVTAILRGPDAELPHPDFFRAQRAAGELRHRDAKTYLFWDRHIDRRFHIEYPRATKHGPRVQGHTIGDTDKEWDALIEWRDRTLAEAGLTLESPATEVARCLAETFAYRNIRRKPHAARIGGKDVRDLNHPIEGLLHGSHCVGCALAFAALAEACGLPARNIGCGGHWVAEAYAEGRWRMADSVGRHEKNDGLRTYFASSYHDTFLDPMGDHGDHITDDYRNGLWGRPNPQFHFTGGTWGGPLTLRWGASNAYALYPDNARWGFKSRDGKRLPILARSGGFYWPTVYGGDHALLRRTRRQTLPLPMHDEAASRDYFYHPSRPGEKLRQSVWLDALDDTEAIEVVFPFGQSWGTDFSERTGRQLLVRVGGFERSLADLGAWPPKADDGSTITRPTGADNLKATVTLPTDAFRPNAVNWIELVQKSATMLYVPLLPAAMEPYIAPLWSETEDRFNPPTPTGW